MCRVYVFKMLVEKFLLYMWQPLISLYLEKAKELHVVVSIKRIFRMTHILLFEIKGIGYKFLKFRKPYLG